MSELLTIKETAEFLRIKIPTLYVWVSRNKIPYCKIGNRTMFRKTELDAWIADRSVPAK